jgi:hypothetical protein
MFRRTVRTAGVFRDTERSYSPPSRESPQTIGFAGNFTRLIPNRRHD